MMIKEIKELWEKYYKIENQKEFALSIKNSPAQSVLFAMRNRQLSLSQSMGKFKRKY